MSIGNQYAAEFPHLDPVSMRALTLLERRVCLDDDGDFWTRISNRLARLVFLCALLEEPHFRESQTPCTYGVRGDWSPPFHGTGVAEGTCVAYIDLIIDLINSTSESSLSIDGTISCATRVFSSTHVGSRAPRESRIYHDAVALQNAVQIMIASESRPDTDIDWEAAHSYLGNFARYCRRTPHMAQLVAGPRSKAAVILHKVAVKFTRIRAKWMLDTFRYAECTWLWSNTLNNEPDAKERAREASVRADNIGLPKFDAKSIDLGYQHKPWVVHPADLVAAAHQQTRESDQCPLFRRCTSWAPVGIPLPERVDVRGMCRDHLGFCTRR